MKIRDYQQKAVDSVFKEWEDHRSTLVVMPTGTGKSHVFAGVVERMKPKRSIVVAHREELIWQARDKIQSAVGMDCCIEMADLSASTNLFSRSPVVIATVQTLISGNGSSLRLDRFSPNDFGCLIIDEGHHAVSPSYKKIIEHFKKNEQLKILSLTATPDRCDEKALGQVFESVAFDYEIMDAIRDGWLVPIEQQMVHIEGLDFSQIRTTAGDLNNGDLNAVLESEGNLHGYAKASIDIIKSRRSIVFTSSVKQAETLSSIFNRYREGMSDWVCGATTKEKRRQTLEDFKTGKTQVVCNCGVLTEGFDNPGVECIIMARPTKSRSLYAQMAGRSTRPLPGIVDLCESAQLRRSAIKNSPKQSCLIVDFVGNSGKHKLISTADILGGNVSDEAVELAAKNAKEKGVPVNMTQELQDAEDEIQKKKEEARLQDEARKRKLVARVTYSSTRIDPFNSMDIVPVKERGWDSGKSLSEKQRSLLMKQGISTDEITYSQGRQLIQEMFRRWGGKLATFRQCALLKKHGYVTKDMTMQTATSLITKLKENGWKRIDKN